jgi:hypothetical protein
MFDIILSITIAAIAAVLAIRRYDDIAALVKRTIKSAAIIATMAFLAATLYAARLVNWVARTYRQAKSLSIKTADLIAINVAGSEVFKYKGTEAIGPIDMALRAIRLTEASPVSQVDFVLDGMTMPFAPIRSAALTKDDDYLAAAIDLYFKVVVSKPRDAEVFVNHNGETRRYAYQVDRST